MNAAEIDNALNTAEQQGTTLVEFTAGSPALLAILAWAKWDGFKAKLRVKILGQTVRDFAPLIEKLFMVPVFGKRPTV